MYIYVYVYIIYTYIYIHSGIDSIIRPLKGADYLTVLKSYGVATDEPLLLDTVCTYHPLWDSKTPGCCRHTCRLSLEMTVSSTVTSSLPPELLETLS